MSQTSKASPTSNALQISKGRQEGDAQAKKPEENGHDETDAEMEEGKHKESHQAEEKQEGEDDDRSPVGSLDAPTQEMPGAKNAEPSRSWKTRRSRRRCK